MDADAPPPLPLFVTVGENDARPFGMAAGARAAALATQAGLQPTADVVVGRSIVFAPLAFTWDPTWLKAIAARPGTVLVKDGDAVLAHVAADGDAAAVRAALLARSIPAGLEPLDADTAELSNEELRKRERPFVLPLDRWHVREAEQAAYDASYKGVTDALTLYLWRRPAFTLTRWAARVGLSPNQVTLVGAALCAATFFLWLQGDFWAGVATGFMFMVLDTVDGKLARCTGQSSAWGNVFDHGIDLVHPPFWWWAWAEGVDLTDFAFEPVYKWMIVGTILFGYVAQRVIEGLFITRFKMHIHVWRRIDSQFRLVTARRNPNMVILVGALLFGRPDVGLELVALWTLFSFVFHCVRLALANDRRLHGLPVISWLA